MNDRRTDGQRWADIVTSFSGSWGFIIWLIVCCTVWIIANRSFTWDPYPFMFMNLTLNIMSSVQSPLILMSHNRQNEIDRENIKAIIERLDELQSTMNKLRDDVDFRE